MNQLYVYPAIFYYDKEEDYYSVAFADLDIFTEGNTIEEAYKSAKEFLYSYIKCSMLVYGEIDAPSNLEDVKKQHEKELVMFVDVEVPIEKRVKA